METACYKGQQEALVCKHTHSQPYLYRNNCVEHLLVATGYNDGCVELQISQQQNRDNLWTLMSVALMQTIFQIKTFIPETVLTVMTY